MSNTLKVWLLIILSYLLKFGAPIGVAYWKLAVHYDDTVGGGFLYFIVSIIFVIMIKRMLAMIKKQKAGYPKAIIKLFVTFVALTILYFAVSYIGTNFSELKWVILSAGGGSALGFIAECFALKIDKVYVEEIGAM